MPFLNRPALLLALAAGCVNTTGRGDGDEDDHRPEIECGANASPDHGECQCEDHYDWCDDAREDCCAWDADAFQFTIVSAFVVPYKDLSDREPWDWDGDIPDWLIDALELIGLAYPDAATAAEVLELIDEYAPELMEGYVPPDPFWELYEEDSLTDAGDTRENTYEPRWEDTFRLEPGDREELILYFWDEDVAFDDDVQGLTIVRDDLVWLSGRGEFTAQRIGNLFELTVEVEPVW